MDSLISIIMSTYNESIEELKISIESMLNQTYENFEFIIILDNPYNNEHKKVINEYLKKDQRIKFIINEKNVGLAITLNRGINIAKGKYIARMDADDISDKNRLKIQFDYMENNNDIDIISTNKYDIDCEGNIVNIPSRLPTNDKKIKKILEITSIIMHSGAFYRKKSIERIGGYRNFPAAQDYDLWLRASYYGLKFAIIDEPLLRYRIRPNNITNTNPLKQICIKEYINKKHKMMKKNGYDDFSVKDLYAYLDNNHAYDDEYISKFKKELNYVEQFKDSLKKRNILKTIKSLLKILGSSKRIKRILIEYVVVYFIK